MTDSVPVVATTADDVDIPTRPTTIALLPFFASGRFPRPDFVGQCRDGRVTFTSGGDLLPRVRDISLGLSALGMTRGSRVAILSESRPEWLFTDLAVAAGGGVTVPVYPTLSAEQIAFILRDCGASIVVVSTAAQLDKLRAVLADVPSVGTIVMIEPYSLALPTTRMVTLEVVSAMGHDRLRAGWGVAREFHEGARQISPDDLATIIYTSGTTAEPKGVMLTHGNLVANLEGVLAVLHLTDRDVALSFLPLCHGFERMVAYIYLTAGVSVAFAESIDTIPRDLQLVKPTVMSGVPRVFEKLRARIFERASQAPAPRRALFNWAVGVAMRRGALLAAQRPLPASLRLASAVSERLVFSKVRAGVGGRLRFAVSGSAPLDPTLATFFYGVGLPILEGYGLTETAPVLCVMPLEHVRFGTVGPPLPNVDLKLADDGEILARGPNVMLGYYNRPDDTAVVMADGWFHTGDIGSFDDVGFLRITDRKKEFIATSGGKKIAPQPIEQRLRQHRLVAEAVLVGDRRHFVGALILPDFVALGSLWGVSADEARRRLSSPETQALIQGAIDEANKDLAQFERVKKFVLLAEELTMANGMLTPTLKVKRRVFEDKYRSEIDAMYA
jgi:long-chain acyl-CoA synthetase